MDFCPILNDYFPLAIPSPVTLAIQTIAVAIYIQNAARVRSLLRINMEQDPPPDLAIETNVTSKTTLEAYATLQVPEVWIYDNGRLTINLLGNGVYQESATSPTFPNLPIPEMIPHLIQQAFQEGTSTMLRQLRHQIS